MRPGKGFTFPRPLRAFAADDAGKTLPFIRMRSVFHNTVLKSSQICGLDALIRVVRSDQSAGPLHIIDLVRAPSPRLVLALEVALVVVLAVQSARLVWMVATPSEVVSAPAVASRPKADLGILARFDAFGPPSAAGRGPVSDSFRLFGVRSGGLEGGSAIIAGADGVQKSYAVGETIADGVVLASVAADHVELSRGGARTTLSFPEPQ